MKIRRDPLDVLFSEYIRKRSKGYCARCGKYYGWKRLQACHFHSRRKKSVRYDPDNACACDFGCHQYLDSNPLEKIDVFHRLLGEEKFTHLNIRAMQTHPKLDKEIIKIFLQEQIKMLEKGEGI